MAGTCAFMWTAPAVPWWRPLSSQVCCHSSSLLASIDTGSVCICCNTLLLGPDATFSPSFSDEELSETRSLQEQSCALTYSKCCHALELALSYPSVHSHLDLIVMPAEVEFDFRVPHVSSINCSGHKYGLVYPGVGWVVWRNRACVDESLICEPAATTFIFDLHAQ